MLITPMIKKENIEKYVFSDVHHTCQLMESKPYAIKPNILWSTKMQREWWYHNGKPNITPIRIYWEYINFRNNWNYSMLLLDIQKDLRTKLLALASLELLHVIVNARYSQIVKIRNGYRYRKGKGRANVTLREGL